MIAVHHVHRGVGTGHFGVMRYRGQGIHSVHCQLKLGAMRSTRKYVYHLLVARFLRASFGPLASLLLLVALGK